MAIKDGTMEPGPLLGSDPGKSPASLVTIFDRLPEGVAETLTPEQKEAILHAADDPSWKRSPVDIRLTIPFFGRKYYFTLVGGAEQRSDERRAEERHHYPLRSAANIFFFIGIATLFYMAAVVLLALQSAIVEF